MNPKTCVLIFASVGGTIGGYLPSIWGADPFSGWGIIASAVGGLLGIWGGYKFSQEYL